MKPLDKIYNLFYYLPQTILIYWGLQLFILYFSPEVYKEWFEIFDNSDVVPCFLVLIHLLVRPEFKILKKKSCYVLAILTMFLIGILNISLELLELKYEVYITIYIALLSVNYAYYLYKSE